MEILTGQKVWLVKSKLGETQGVIGVFNNSFAAEKYAEENIVSGLMIKNLLGVEEKQLKKLILKRQRNS